VQEGWFGQKTIDCPKCREESHPEPVSLNPRDRLELAQRIIDLLATKPINPRVEVAKLLWRRSD